MIYMIWVLSWCPFAKRSVSCFEYVCLNFVQISVNGGVAALLSELAVLKKRLRPIGAHPCPSVPIPIDSKIKSDSVSLIENFDGKHQDIQYCNLGLFMSLWRFLRKESQKGLTNNLSVSFLLLFFPLKCLKCLFPGFSDFRFLQELSGFSGLSFDVLHWRVFFRWSVSSPRPPSVVARRRRWRHCSEEAGFPSDVDVLDNRNDEHDTGCAGHGVQHLETQNGSQRLHNCRQTYNRGTWIHHRKISSYFKVLENEKNRQNWHSLINRNTSDIGSRCYNMVRKVTVRRIRKAQQHRSLSFCGRLCILDASLLCIFVWHAGLCAPMCSTYRIRFSEETDPANRVNRVDL